MNYRLLAIDLDGTLLCPEGKVSRENLDAIVDAQAAGLTVVPCTGRGWREAKHVLNQVPSLGIGVFVTGAAITDVPTGQTKHFTALTPDTAAELIDLLKDEPQSVLAFREPNRIGHEYLITGNGELTANSKWWFDYTGAVLHTQRYVTPDDLLHTLRVSMVAPGSCMPRILAKVNDRFADRVEAHAFAAVPAPDPEDAIHIIEIFAPGVDKWFGLSWIAEQMNIGSDQIAVIGDEINDVAMLQAAGCSIAMENAADAAKQHAAYVTKPNHDHGVAHAIQQILGGHW
jgi:hydroxymethylpyrimidine pyrophosphatase-like HAD family hydrolase